MKIVIVGAGAMGQALAGLIQDKRGITIDFWDKDSSRVTHQKSLSELVKIADSVWLCIPSWAVREVATLITPDVLPQTSVISIAKGLEKDTHKTMATVLAETLPPNQPWALLNGPMLADEIAAGQPAVGVIATTTHSVFTKLKNIFAETPLLLEFNRDVEGVALASVLKNIYTIGVGIGEGLGFADNFRGWFIGRATGEIALILKYVGATSSTAYSTAGVGDFIATSISPYSRNHLVGRELGQHGQTELTSEGLKSLDSLWQRLTASQLQLPLLDAIKRVVIDKESPRPVFLSLFH